MELRVARSGGVRGRAGCEGCGVSHSPAQILWNEGRRMGPARPGGTRHQDSRQGGSPVEGGEAVVLCQELGWGHRRNMAWDFSMCVPLWGPESPSGCFPTPAVCLLLPLLPFAKAFLPHLYEHGWRRSLHGSLSAPRELPYKTDRLRQCPHMYQAHCS